MSSTRASTISITTSPAAPAAAEPAAAPAKPAAASKATPPPAAKDEESDDEIMASLSGDDDDSDDDSGAAAQALIAKKNAERDAAKREKKGGPIAKSSLILDIKPEDSETDIDQLLAAVKAIEQEGLLWGGHEYIPVAYGIRKLRILAIIVDDLVSVDDLQQALEELDGVQSTDIEAFNKL